MRENMTGTEVQVDSVQSYHERRAKAHREMARKAGTGSHGHIHVKLAELHDAAAHQQGHTLAIADNW